MIYSIDNIANFQTNSFNQHLQNIKISKNNKTLTANDTHNQLAKSMQTRIQTNSLQLKRQQQQYQQQGQVSQERDDYFNQNESNELCQRLVNLELDSLTCSHQYIQSNVYDEHTCVKCGIIDKREEYQIHQELNQDDEYKKYPKQNFIKYQSIEIHNFIKNGSIKELCLAKLQQDQQIIPKHIIDISINEVLELLNVINISGNKPLKVYAFRVLCNCHLNRIYIENKQLLQILGIDTKKSGKKYIWIYQGQQIYLQSKYIQKQKLSLTHNSITQPFLNQPILNYDNQLIHDQFNYLCLDSQITQLQCISEESQEISQVKRNNDISQICSFSNVHQRQEPLFEAIGTIVFSDSYLRFQDLKDSKIQQIVYTVPDSKIQKISHAQRFNLKTKQRHQQHLLYLSILNLGIQYLDTYQYVFIEKTQQVKLRLIKQLIKCVYVIQILNQTNQTNQSKELPHQDQSNQIYEQKCEQVYYQNQDQTNIKQTIIDRNISTSYQSSQRCIFINQELRSHTFKGDSFIKKLDYKFYQDQYQFLQDFSQQNSQRQPLQQDTIKILKKFCKDNKINSSSITQFSKIIQILYQCVSQDLHHKSNSQMNNLEQMCSQVNQRSSLKYIRYPTTQTLPKHNDLQFKQSEQRINKICDQSCGICCRDVNDNQKEIIVCDCLQLVKYMRQTHNFISDDFKNNLMYQKDDIDTFIKLLSNCLQLQTSYLNFLKHIQEQLTHLINIPRSQIAQSINDPVSTTIKITSDDYEQ